ncbi:MAG TPA: CPBP family intramembrane glutamic endopeptidase [Candidatus Acidoferrum sp.]|nr:CPBP family intramembrane glutamic endopeptidase [Candidatus Acidoferrum sp.]
MTVTDQPSDKQSNIVESPPPAIRHGWLRAVLFFITYIVVLIAVTVVAASLLGLKSEEDFAGGDHQLAGILNYLIALAITMLIVWLFRRFVDRRSVVSLGFQFQRQDRLDFIYGVAWGIGMVAGIFLILMAMNVVHVSSVQFPISSLVFTLITFVLAAAMEEIVMRGYMLNNMMASMNRYVSLLIVSAVFGLAHGFNPNVSIAGLFNIVIAGLLLGVYYIYRQNLWFPIGMHIGWNYFQGVVFGSPVSGAKLTGVLSIQCSGSELLSGGDFGFEASLITTFVTAGACVLIGWWQYRRQRQPVIP